MHDSSLRAAHHYNNTLSPRKAHLSSKKLLEQCQKMEKLWGHVLTSTLPLHADNWYNKVTDLIEKQQTAPIWMSDSKVSRAMKLKQIFNSRRTEIGPTVVRCNTDCMKSWVESRLGVQSSAKVSH